MSMPIGDIPFESENDWRSWLLDHALDHDLIYQAAVDKGAAYNPYPLLDSRGKDDKEWLYSHYLEHQAIYDTLGIGGLPDLASVDMTRKDQWQNWMDIHREIHDFIDQTLGI